MTQSKRKNEGKPQNEQIYRPLCVAVHYPHAHNRLRLTGGSNYKPVPAGAHANGGVVSVSAVRMRKA